MKRPKQKDTFGTDYKEAIGYNLACEEWEAYHYQEMNAQLDRLTESFTKALEENK